MLLLNFPQIRYFRRQNNFFNYILEYPSNWKNLMSSILVHIDIWVLIADFNILANLCTV